MMLMSEGGSSTQVEVVVVVSTRDLSTTSVTVAGSSAALSLTEPSSSKRLPAILEKPVAPISYRTVGSRELSLRKWSCLTLFIEEFQCAKESRCLLCEPPGWSSIQQSAYSSMIRQPTHDNEYKDQRSQNGKTASEKLSLEK